MKAIAKSIANWTFKHFTPSKFRESQAKKGAKGSREDKAKAGFIGGRVSKGGGRPDKKNLLPQVISLKLEGKSNREIAVQVGVGSATVSRWLRSNSAFLSDPKQSLIR